MNSIAEILAAKRNVAAQSDKAGIRQLAENLSETVAAAPLKLKSNGEDHVDAIPQTQTRSKEQEVFREGEYETRKPSIKPSDLLRDYSSLAELKSSTVWKLLGIGERVRIAREWIQRANAGDNDGDQAEAVIQESDSKVFDNEPRNTKEPSGDSGESNSFGDVTVFSESKTILNRFLDFESLKHSDLWKQMSISQKASIAREYSKQAQEAAISAYRMQAGLEKEMIKEEQDKVSAEKLAAEASHLPKKHQAFSLDIKLNEQQELGVTYALSGKSFVLTGAAGTGKTTACREMARAFLKRGDLGHHTFKIGDRAVCTSHGIAFCSYTRRATANIRRALHKDAYLEEELNVNVVTIHKLLEFEPEFYVGEDGKNKMRFIPKRNRNRLLDVRVIVIEEASMLGLDLYEKLFEAMREGTILVFVGDINQLPPVFGKSIMNYALGQLPVVELTEVYRQALDSGVIVNAHHILKGEAPVVNQDTQLVTGTRKEHVPQEKMSRALGATFFQLWDKKEYDPEQDIILSPWNKQPCGTDNLNNWIAQFLGEKRNAMIYEIFAGRRKMYLAIGDRVMYEKQDGIITSIRHNTDYLGRSPQPAGTDLTRFGMRKMSSDAKHEDFEAMAVGYANLNIDEVQDEEKKQQSSHVVEVTLDDGRKDYLRSIGDYAENVFSLGYVLTVHKAQGCEWRKVYVVLHKDHTLGGFLTRELLYTACTRAREKLIIIAKPDVLAKCVKQQSIRGNTLQEKIQSINSGAQNIGSYPVLKLKNPITA